VNSLKDVSTRQLERLYEQADGDLNTLVALQAELAQRPSTQAKALLAEIQVETFRLQQGDSDELIDWDQMVAQRQQHAAASTDIEYTNQTQCILDAWMVLETLSPQAFRTPEELAHRGSVLPFEAALPWESSTSLTNTPTQLGPHQSLYYQVYLGDFDARDAQEELIDIYGRDAEQLRASGFIPLAVATVNQHGILAGDFGVGVACFAWSFGRARLGKIEHLPYWHGAERLLVRRLRKKLTCLDEEQRPRPLELNDLDNAVTWLIRNLDLPVDMVRPARFAVAIVQHSNRLPPSSPLLNSFVLGDLARAKVAVRQDKQGPVLRRYLTHVVSCAPSLKETIPQVLADYLKPAMLPLGRWPNADIQLDALQQTAVNIALQPAPQSPGLFSVHGPPGTGKTTLLRDVIAGLLTQRAQALVKFDDPEQAFAKAVHLKFGDQHHEIFPIDQSLAGFEILVCSRNNKAVENISLELPLCTQVNRDTAQIDFFQKTMAAYFLEKEGRDDKASDQQQVPLFPELSLNVQQNYWGLIAAALGNGANRRAYIKSVWSDESHGFKRYFELMKAWWQAAQESDQALQQPDLMPEYDFLPDSKHRALELWQEARADFNLALLKVNQALPTTLDYSFTAYTVAPKPILQQARDQLFNAALRLQQAFILVCAPQFNANLSAYFRLLAGVRCSKPELLPHLWTSGSFITPVVSSTFASVSRMLNDMPNQSIGWAMIDEAGQAAPQDAVGLLLRCKKALVVGDPQQIEPVVGVPQGLVAGVARHYGVEQSQWMAPDVSVQMLADRVNPFGMCFQHRQTLPIGWPMLVHRRCAEPMFSIINEMAYDGSMVGPNRQGQAAWLNVVDPAPGSKWSAIEGQYVAQLVLQLLQSDVQSIYVISPFRDCAYELRQMFKSMKSQLQHAGIANVVAWIRQSVGTVHTFQGREAHSVIFVLGAQGDQHYGARQWASRRVNLCNVAVSRAQSCFYVVGNRQQWGPMGAMRVINNKLGIQQ